MKRVCIIITTRGNYAKMKSVIAAIQESDCLELQVIVGGGAVLHKYGNILESIEANGIHVDRTVHYLIEGENPTTMAKSAGLAITEFATVFGDLRPDVVVVIADRYETLSIAMAASYMNIPLAHVEGGEVSGSIDESVRHAVTKLAHLHFPATEGAANRIRKMGEDASTVFNVGCTSLDVIRELDLSDLSIVDEAQRKSGLGPTIDLSDPYIVVIQHPVTTEYEDNLAHINETIQAIDRLKMNTIWIWPNMDAGADGISKGIRMFREKRRPQYVHFFKSLPIEAYAPLLKNARCIVGNSSSGIRESAFLGVPSVNIGTRQQGRERGRNVIDVAYDAEEIAQAVVKQVERGTYEPDFLYGNGEAGKKIVSIMERYEYRLQKSIVY